jgi:arsenate reductase
MATLCDDARDNCPVFPGKAKRIHWSFENPAEVQGDEEVRLDAFRRIRDQIRNQVDRFFQEQTAPAQ